MKQDFVSRKGRRRAKIVFVTGTGTGVGKTVATGLLLHHLRRAGVNALAVKLFSCGGRDDAQKLQKIQGKALSADEVNPFYFQAPLAPLAAGRLEGRRVTLRQAVLNLRRVLPRCDTLLVEGCGGLLVPLGHDFSFLDIIKKLRGDILLVGPNRLGVLNHVLLTLCALPPGARQRTKILLMGQQRPDLSARTNTAILGEFISFKKIFNVPFLGHNPLAINGLRNLCKKIEKTLAALAG